MKVLIYLFLIVFVIGCNTNNKINCTITSSELLQQNHGRIFGTNLKFGSINEFRDKGTDSIAGGYYVFYYNNRHLKSYQFFANFKTYVYEEDYDSLGNLIRIEGSPLVHSVIKRINNDSIEVKAYFFSMKKSYKPIVVKINDSKTFSLDLKEDSLYSNMRSGVFGFNFKGNNQVKIKFGIEYEATCFNRTYILKDSITLKSEPPKALQLY
jgi:hypothetical protein